MNKQLENAVYNVLESSPDVFPFHYDEQWYWVKKATKNGSNVLHRLVYKVLQTPVLAPVKKMSPAQSIVYEAQRMRRLKADFPYLPEVVTYTEEFMVTVDCGEDLRSLVKYRITDSSGVDALFKRAVEHLAKLHGLQHFHGGAQIKNFTLKEGELYLVDFEEDFQGIALPDLQFRDLLLFLNSVARTGYAVDYPALIERYGALSGHSDFHQRLQGLKERFSFLWALLQNPVVYRLADKDTKGMYRLFKQL